MRSVVLVWVFCKCFVDFFWTLLGPDRRASWECGNLQGRFPRLGGNGGDLRVGARGLGTWLPVSPVAEGGGLAAEVRRSRVCALGGCGVAALLARSPERALGSQVPRPRAPRYAESPGFPRTVISTGLWRVSKRLDRSAWRGGMTPLFLSASLSLSVVVYLCSLARGFVCTRWDPRFVYTFPRVWGWRPLCPALCSWFLWL
jgi:hypothetical protein